MLVTIFLLLVLALALFHLSAFYYCPNCNKWVVLGHHATLSHSTGEAVSLSHLNHKTCSHLKGWHGLFATPL